MSVPARPPEETTAIFGIECNMGIVVRPVTYTGTQQKLVVTSWLAQHPITVQLWGGGGGGGGTNAGRGGYGSGGGYAAKTFSVSTGDIIEVAVGQGGGGGLTQAFGGIGGGHGGASFIFPATVFDMRTAVGTWGGIASPTSYSSWLPWFNEHAVNIPTLPWTYTVNFPVSGTYAWQVGADYAMDTYLDGVLINSISGYTGSYISPSPVEFAQYVAAGNHTVQFVPNNDGGTVGFACVIQNFNQVWSGAPGGNAGPTGASGGGGGGGGATVVFLNGVPIAVAGGGGGGGGAGVSDGNDAPGAEGRATAGINNGQNGRSNISDGGGGGGGGGGYGGGNGGLPVYYDQGATAGSTGGNLGDAVAEPSGRLPGVASAYGSVGQGGLVSTAGTNGLAAFSFDISGLSVKDAGVWKDVQDVYAKLNGSWSLVQEIYIKQNGQWVAVDGTENTAPVFEPAAGSFGVSSRPNPTPD